MNPEVYQAPGALQIRPAAPVGILAAIGSVIVAVLIGYKVAVLSGVVALALMLPAIICAVLWNRRARVILDSTGLHLQGLRSLRSYPFAALAQPVVVLNPSGQPQLLCLRRADGTNLAALPESIWGHAGLTTFAAAVGAATIPLQSRAAIEGAFPGALPWRERHLLAYSLLMAGAIMVGLAIVVAAGMFFG